MSAVEVIFKTLEKEAIALRDAEIRGASTLKLARLRARFMVLCKLYREVTTEVAATEDDWRERNEW